MYVRNIYLDWDSTYRYIGKHYETIGFSDLLFLTPDMESETPCQEMYVRNIFLDSHPTCVNSIFQNIGFCDLFLLTPDMEPEHHALSPWIYF